MKFAGEIVPKPRVFEFTWTAPENTYSCQLSNGHCSASNIRLYNLVPLRNQ